MLMDRWSGAAIWRQPSSVAARDTGVAGGGPQGGSTAKGAQQHTRGYVRASAEAHILYDPDLALSGFTRRTGRE
ncbi:MAG: hypothetical protein ACLRT5_09485 [Lachnospiraceae bacterium]